MTGVAEDCSAALDQLDFTGRYVDRDPLRWVRLTDPQRHFASLTQRFALIRSGNQIGKSYGLAYDIVCTARGVHPLRKTFRAPVEIAVLGESFSAMDPLLGKIWRFLPRHEVDPEIDYVPGLGIIGHKEKIIRLVDGPGAGSIIYVLTYAQGTGAIAGRTLHAVFGDEPMPESTYGELVPRLNHHRGIMRLGFTPTLESPPLEYLQEQIKLGLMHEYQVSITEQTVTPRGSRLIEVPRLTERQIETDISRYLEIEREMRRNGAWDPLRKGRWIDAYAPEHFGRFAPPADEDVYLVVTFDHGVKPGRQVGLLTACSHDGSQVWFLDEYCPGQRTTSRQDAAGILAMLARQGLRWSNVDWWIGDRSHSGDEYSTGKSNADLLEGFCAELRKDKRTLIDAGFRIHTAFKPKGSLSRDSRLLNDLFLGGQAKVNLRCQKLNAGLLAWEGRKEDHHKDPIDAARYAAAFLRDRLVLRPRRDKAVQVR